VEGLRGGKGREKKRVRKGREGKRGEDGREGEGGERKHGRNVVPAVTFE